MKSRVIDSSVWISFFCDLSWSEQGQKYLQDVSLIVPSIVLFEVYRKLRKTRNESEAMIAVAQIGKNQVIPLDSSLALAAGDVSLQHGLAMADAIVYTTALLHHAELFTRDNDFRSLAGVTVV